MVSSRFLGLLEELGEMHEKKSSGYSGKSNPDPWANFRGSEKLGVPAWRGCIIRLSDKYTRLGNIVADPTNEQVGEKVTDTLMDLASYALITICLLEEAESGTAE